MSANKEGVVWVVLGFDWDYSWVDSVWSTMEQADARAEQMADEKDCGWDVTHHTIDQHPDD